MKIGTSMHALTDFGNDVKPFFEALDDAADCGFDSVMLMNSPGKPALTAGAKPPCALIDLGASDPDAVRRAVTDAGLEIACVYQACMRVATDDEAAESAATLAEVVELAGRLGTSVAIPNAGVAPCPQTPVGQKEELLERVANVLMTALEEAPPQLRLAPDIHYGAVIETVADCRRLFELASDARVGITLNIGHMTTLGEKGWVLAQEHRERVHVVAWKDHLVTLPPEAEHPVYSVELGTGDSPFEKYVEALGPHAESCVNLITFEHVALEEKKEALRRSLQYLKGLQSG